MNTNSEDDDLKRTIGRRFRQFRENELGITQAQLAIEFGVHQSTVTNIEIGNSYPRMDYLAHLHLHYGMNVNWLVSGLGVMRIEDGVELRPGECFDVLKRHSAELAELMKIPEIRQIIFAKMTELKVILQNNAELRKVIGRR